MASNTTATTAEQVDESDFMLLASNIDSDVDEKFEDTFQLLELFNLLSDNFFFDGGKFIPVGSCIDGSKVNIPGDSGDIDILIVSNKIVLNEALFVYDNRYPAFLYIRTDREHHKYFHETKHLINGKYLPASVLKELNEKYFGFARGLVKRLTAQGVSNEGDFFNVTRHSSVGLEKSQLDLDTFLGLGIEDESQNLDFFLSRMGKFGQTGFKTLGLNTIASNVANVKCCDDPDSFFTVSNACIEQFQKSISTLATEDRKDENRKQTQKKHRNIEQSVECEKQTEFVPERERISKSIEYSNNDFQNDFDSEIETDDRSSAQPQKEYDVLGKENKHSEEKISFHRFCSADFVPAFRFEGWPRTAEEWIYRKRLWPSKGTMKEILDKGCQVVAKRPFALNSGVPLCDSTAEEEMDPYFRLPFTLSEIILAKNLSKHQKLCWRVLKAYQKVYLGTNPRVLTSYHWKNVIFWISEGVGPLYWSDGNVTEGVRRSLDFMITCLRQKFFPFYFVRKMNLLNGCNENAIHETCTRVKMIRNKPFDYLNSCLKFPSVPEHVSVKCDEIKKIMSRKYAALQIDSAFEIMGTTFLRQMLDTYRTRDPLSNFENHQMTLNSAARMIKQHMERNVENGVDSTEFNSQTMKILEVMEHFDYKNLTTWYEGLSNCSESFSEILKCAALETESSNENVPEHVKESLLSLTKSFSKFLSLVSSVMANKKNMLILIEDFCDTSETVRKAITEIWMEEGEKQDSQTKEKINTILSLSETYSLLLPHLRRLSRPGMQIPKPFANRDKEESRNKTEIEIELD